MSTGLSAALISGVVAVVAIHLGLLAALLAPLYAFFRRRTRH